MGRIGDFFLGSTPVEVSATQEVAESFELSETTVNALVFGSGTATYVPAIPKVDRKSAMSVPAVATARKLICEALGALPIDMIGPDKKSAVSPLLSQPENFGIPRSVTMAYTLEDLLFHGQAWWLITEFAWTTYPSKVRRIDPSAVTVQENGDVYIDGKRVAPEKYIRFYSPTDPILVSGARAIRTCLMLDAAAHRFADGVPPLDYFTPRDDVDPVTEDVQDMLDGWAQARRVHATGYVSGQLDYHTAGWNPEQLQMQQAREFAITEIARLTGLDAESLNVSTTSRTYYGAFDRNKYFVDYVLGPYRQAVEERLSMNDITPRGYIAKFNLSAYLRSDDLTRMQTYAAAKTVGALTGEEIRELEDRPPLTASQVPAPAPTPEVVA